MFSIPSSLKRRSSFSFLCICVVVGFSLLFSACGSSTSTGSTSAPKASIAAPTDLIAAGTLTVGSDTTYPPQEFIDTASGKPTGFDVDLITEMAKRMGLTARVVTANFTTIVDDLKAKRYDVVISAQSVTPERQKQVDFVPYFNAGQSLLVAKGNPKKIQSITDLCGKTVGIQDGTVEVDTMKAANLAECKANPAKLTTLGAQTDVINLLVTGRADATFQDSPVTDYYLQQNSGRFDVAGSIINAAPEGITVRKGDTSMFTAIRQAFTDVKSDGTYNSLFQKWHLNNTQELP